MVAVITQSQQEKHGPATTAKEGGGGGEVKNPEGREVFPECLVLLWLFVYIYRAFFLVSS